MNVQILHSIPSKKASANSSEKVLWTEVQNGKQDALSSLFCLYYKKLYNYGYKIVSCEELVKDCIQELFLTLWKSRRSVDDVISVKSYLYSSMRRMIFKEIRKHKARKERNKKYADITFDEVLSIEDLMIHFETEQKYREQLIQAIQSLGKKHKEVIYLKFYEGLSTDEIALIIGIQQQTVYNYVSESIQKLHYFMRV